ncbi:MAG TPA: DUF983 domain-containing protein [Acidimicrobiia bacterium]
MDPELDPKFPARVGRALTRRCPRCGAPVFESYFTMREVCSGCGHRFEREPGYWAGALIINTAFIFGLFLTVFLVGIVLTWPDVPWTTLLIVLVITNLTIPILFYPQSKTLWVAAELGWNPVERSEKS